MLRTVCGVFLAILLAASLASPFAVAQVAPTNTASIAGSVTTSDGKPVVGAEVVIRGPSTATTHTDAHGLFDFIAVAYGTYRLSVTASGLGTVSRQMSVNEDINVSIQYSATSALKTIAHVSTAAINVTPASITHIDPLANIMNGQTSWRQLLEQIPGVSITTASYGMIMGQVANNPMFDQQISIDGALPYESAILFDDMPLISNSLTSSPGAGTNIGIYPMIGFSSGDVVRGPGANAPSIVDSIGGSLDMHPPGIVQKNEFELSFTRDPYGGIDFAGAAGARIGRLSITATDAFENSPGPSRAPGASGENPPFLVDGKSFIGNYPTFLYPPGYQQYGGFGEKTNFLVCCYTQYFGWQTHSAAVALNYELSNRVTAGVYFSGQTGTIPWYTPLYAVNFQPPAGYTGSIPAGVMDLSGGNSSYSSGNSPAQYQTDALFEEKITAQIGNGQLRVAMLQNTSKDGDSTPGDPGPLVGQLYGGGELCSNTSTNCSTGTYNPVVFNGGTYNLLSPSTACNLVLTVQSRDESIGYTTPIGDYAHAGVSFVQSYYDDYYGGSYHFIYGPGQNYAGPYPETSRSIALTTRETRFFVGGQPTRNTSIDLSWYMVGADYHLQNPFNTNVYTDSNFAYSAPRLGFVWRPTPAVSVRAAVGGGFAEAPLFDLVGEYAPSCFGAVCTARKPNLGLQPEKSSAVNLGTDVRMNQSTVASFDIYRANLWGQIDQSTMLDGTYTGLPLYLESYQNLGHTRYEGVLLDLRSTVEHGFNWSLAAGLTRGYLVSVPAGFYNGTTGFPPVPCTNCSNTGILTNINFDAAFSGDVPYAQGHALVGYTWKPGEYVNLDATYYGNNNSYLRPAFVEMNAAASYPVSRYAALVVNFENVTGVYDAAFGVIGPGAITVLPAVRGALPFAFNNGQYGPQTVTVTLQVHS